MPVAPCEGARVNLLLTGAWQNAQVNVPVLEAAGYEVCFLQQEADALPCDPAWPEAVVCNGLFQHHDIRSFERLRFVQLTSAGADRVPEDYIREAGVELHTARGVYSAPMAEHAVAGVLALYRQLPAFVRSQGAHVWQKRRNLRELAGSTVCIIGCGSVGTECARRFSALGCTVVGVSHKPRTQAHRAMPTEPFDIIVGPEALECDADRDTAAGPMDRDTERDANIAAPRPPRASRALEAADILILAVPLTPQTRHLADAAFLARLRRDAVLVNLSRGAVVDEQALAAALATNRLGGAVLDVFEEEPLPATSPLWDRDDVLITPHNSFSGTGNASRLDACIMQNLREYAADGEEAPGQSAARAAESKNFTDFFALLDGIEGPDMKLSRSPRARDAWEIASKFFSTANVDVCVTRHPDAFIATSETISDIVAFGTDRENAIRAFCQDFYDYAQDYYAAYEFYSAAPNRASHAPYVFRALLAHDLADIRDMLVVTDV